MKNYIVQKLNEAIQEAQRGPNQALIENKHPEQTTLIQQACETVSPELAGEILGALKNLLMSPFPSGGFAFLKENGVLDGVFPEYGRLYGVPQVEIYHPEIDTGIHLAMCLDYAAKVDMPWMARFAVFCHDFGKGITPADILPHHYEHEIKGTDLVKDFCAKWGVGKAEEELAIFVTEHHGTWHRAPESSDKKVVKFLLNHDLNNQDEFRTLVGLACIADSRGRLGLEHSTDHTAILFEKVCRAWKNMDKAEQLATATQRFESYLQRKAKREEEPTQTIRYFLDDLIYREQIRLVSESRPKKSNAMTPC